MAGELVIALAEEGGRLVPRLTLPPPPPVGPLVSGLAPEAAAAMLGRVFNLCRHAQEAAARLALGLPAADTAPLGREILCDTVFRLFVALPAAMGQRPQALPAGWQVDGARLAAAAFGRLRRPPETLAAFGVWLAAGEGLAPILARLARLFAPGEAACPALPFAGEEAGLSENSAAMRHPGHPLLAGIEREYGRGPLWRAAARLLDLDACLAGRLAPPRLTEPGRAEAPAARGLYRIAVEVCDSRVAGLCRQTPTDDICQPGGPLLSSLATLPHARRHLAPLVIEIFDPCLPWRIEEMADA